jgi:hypothetical protein
MPACNGTVRRLAAWFDPCEMQEEESANKLLGHGLTP